jgi:hypothetical protein
MSDEKDWNEILAERLAAQDRERADKLRKAKFAAWFTTKERFKVRKFKRLYKRLNPEEVDDLTPWETLIKESEYDYYVVKKDIKRLEKYVRHLLWLDGFG